MDKKGRKVKFSLFFNGTSIFCCPWMLGLLVLRCFFGLNQPCRQHMVGLLGLRDHVVTSRNKSLLTCIYLYVPYWSVSLENPDRTQGGLREASLGDTFLIGKNDTDVPLSPRLGHLADSSLKMNEVNLPIQEKHLTVFV